MNVADRARANLRRYPWYVGALAAHAWVPVFFLYLSSRVTLPEVLTLEAIYYVAVVALEVPSGYFSDRVGRRPTLIIAAAAVMAAGLTFAAGTAFWHLAAAQVLLAVGLAFNSGTDTSFHLANLTALGEEQSYAEREARLAGLAFATGAGAALVGGALGVLDLRWAYVASAGAAGVALCVALSLQTLPEDEDRAHGFARALRDCVTTARQKPLAWLFAVSVTATVVNHIPYEFYQPYLAALPDTPWPSDGTPLVAGLHVAAVAAVAMLAARASARIADRLGVVPHLLLTVAIQVGLVWAMALTLHPLVAVLLVARSAPRALQAAPLRAAVTPRVAPRLRATYLSLQSLAGRLAFAALLLGLAQGAGDVDEALFGAGCVAVGLLALVAVLSPKR